MQKGDIKVTIHFSKRHKRKHGVKQLSTQYLISLNIPNHVINNILMQLSREVVSSTILV